MYCIGPPLISHLYYLQFDSTPLHLAVSCGKTAAVQLLLEAGADKEAKDKVSSYMRCSYTVYRYIDPQLISYFYYVQFNKTPLLIAAKNGLAGIAQILLKAGADKDVKDDVSRY